jgi:hypothetical protein
MSALSRDAAEITPMAGGVSKPLGRILHFTCSTEIRECRGFAMRLAIEG